MTTLILKIVDFPFVDGDVPRSTSYGVCISQLNCFSLSIYVTDFNTRNKLLAQNFLNKAIEALLRQGLSETGFYGDLVYKLKRIVGSNNF